MHVPYFQGAYFKSDICFQKFRAQIRNLGITNFKTNFNKKSHVPYFDGADFKSDVGFWKFRVQISKNEYFGPKSIKSFVLRKLILIYLDQKSYETPRNI